MTARAKGWYADPVAVGATRYWDGRGWTNTVSWAGTTQFDPTPIAEVERRLAAAEADVVLSYLDNAIEQGLITHGLVSQLRHDLEKRSRARTQILPHRGLPSPSPTAAAKSSLSAPKTEPSKAKPPTTNPPTTKPPKTKPPKTEPSKAKPPKAKPPKIKLPEAEPPKTEPSKAKPVGVKPVRLKPGTLARWRDYAKEAVRSDLMLHGIAYLGVLLMFAGILGLIAFSFGDIAAEFRTLTELLVPASLLLAGRYLRNRGAPTVSKGLTLIGAGLVPLVALASVTDNAPIPPDVTGRTLPVVHGALCIVVAAAMYAIVRVRDGATPVRFLFAPVIWLGVGLFAAIFLDEVPQGYDVPRASALQLATVLVAVAVTMVVFRRWQPAGPLSKATMTVALPTAGSAYVLELVLAGNEGWPLPAAVLSGLAALVIVDIATVRIPEWARTVAQVLVIGITWGRVVSHTDPEWTAAVTVLALLTLVEYAGWRRPTTMGSGLALGGVGYALIWTVESPGAGSLAFGAAAGWALWRHFSPPTWLTVVDRAGVVPAVAAAVAVGELWRFGAGGPNVLLTGGGLMLLAVAGHRWPLVRADLLWQWLVPTAAATLTVASLSFQWGEMPGSIAAGTGMAAAAMALSALRVGPKMWLTAGISALSLANLATLFELGRDAQLVGFAILALLLVLLGLARDWPIAHHLAFIGHTTAIGTIVAVDGLGWTCTLVVGAATAGWLATSVVNEKSDAAHIVWLRRTAEASSPDWATWADDLSTLVSIAGVTLTALLAGDAGSVIAIDGAWAPAVVAGASVVAGTTVHLVRWRRSDPRVLIWTTVVMSLGAAWWAASSAPEVSSWSVITCLGLGLVVVAVARAPRPLLFAWVGWAEVGLLAVLVPQRVGLSALWIDTVLIGWGALALLGSLVLDRRHHGPAASRAFVRQRSLLPPASLGIVAIAMGTISGLTHGTTTEIGWMSAGLAVVALAAALLLSLGVLAALAEILAFVSLLLLLPWDPIEHPWSIIPFGVAVFLVAWLTWTPGAEPYRGRWDIPTFVVAHGMIVTALVAAIEEDSIPPTFFAAAAVLIAVSLVVRQWPWAAAGAVLALFAAPDAGPGLLALVLLVAGVALTVVALHLSPPRRVFLLQIGAASIVGSWFSFTDWLSWSTPTVLYTTAPGAAAVSVGASALLRSRRTHRDLAIVWIGVGAITSIASTTLGLHMDVARRPGGLAVAAAFTLVGIAVGMGASRISPALRWLAVALLALVWLPLLWALEPTVAFVAIVMTLLALGLFVAALATSALAPSTPWLGPAVLWAVVTQIGGAAAAIDDLPSTDLLIVVLLAIAAELVAIGPITARPSLCVASPALACTAWILYAGDALAGDANWLTVPIGITVLVTVGLIRWIRADRGGEVVGLDIVLLDLVGMAFTVAAPLARTLAGDLANALLAMGIGLALASWGAISKVRRRLGFGVAAVVLAVLLLIGVPLSDIATVKGPGLWITVIIIGLAAVTTAATLEQSRDRVAQIKHRLDEMTQGWERIGAPGAAQSG